MPFRPSSALPALLLAACIALPAPATAGIMQAASPSQLAPGIYVRENFEDATYEPGFSLDGEGLQRRSSALFSSGVTVSGTQVLAVTGTTLPLAPLRIDFTQPTLAAGVWFGNDDPAPLGGFSTVGLRVLLDVVAVGGDVFRFETLANRNDWVDQFIGFTGDVPVERMSLQYICPNPSATVTNRACLFKTIDDLTFRVGPQPSFATPAPSVGAVLAALLPFVAWHRRRQRRAAQC